MKLQSIKFNKVENIYNDRAKSIKTSSPSLNTTSNDLKSYPSNYYISFGTRSIKEIYDDYSETEMPSTVKCFIDDLSLTTSKDRFDRLMAQPQLYQIQRLAFKELEGCKTVEDIKRAYPAEKCFKNIRKVEDVPQAGGGIFNIISAKLNKGQKVFDIDEDLTVYIIKQLFYEGVSMTDIQKKVASFTVDNEVREKITNSKTWAAKTFLPLGIDAPDGIKYGKAILYSEDSRYATALSEALTESWRGLTSEEVTKRIDKLLQGSKKERLTMIDAWNKCISLRNELSDFLFENLDNDRYSMQDVDFIDSIYEGNFSIKMKKIMMDFWKAHPEEKIELGEEIRKSRKIYEEKLAQGPEVFDAYEKEIIAQKNVIKQRLKDEREKARSFGAAKQLIFKMAEKSKQMYIKTPETVDDLYNVLLQYVTNKQLKIYEQRLVLGNNVEEFNAAYPPRREIEQAKKSLEYSNIMYSQIATILLPDLKRVKLSEEDIILALKDKDSLDELVKKCAKNRTNVEIGEYSKMKKLLSQGEKECVRNVLIQYLPQDENTLSVLDKYLDTQGKYLMQITSENQLIRNTFIMLALQKLGEISNNEYVEGFVEQVQDERKQQSKLIAIDSIDWSNFIAPSWDI